MRGTKCWKEVPCVAMFEDIDAVFHGRRNVAVASGPSLTFDCLLNCLDGVQRANGLLTFMTTNHLELVDPAIGQPGEIGSRPDGLIAWSNLPCLMTLVDTKSPNAFSRTSLN